MNYEIRKSKKSDIKTLLEISRRVTNTNNRQFLPSEMIDAFLESDDFIKEITDYIGEIDVLTLNNKIIGMCRFNNNILESLIIDCKYQGTGAAQYFIIHLLDEKFQIYNEVYLECFYTNKRANRFYKKMGFSLIETYKNNLLNQNMNKYKKNKQ